MSDVSAFTISLLVIAVAGGFLALGLAAFAQRSSARRPGGLAQHEPEQVIDLRTEANKPLTDQWLSDPSLPAQTQSDRTRSDQAVPGERVPPRPLSSHGDAAIASHDSAAPSTTIAESHQVSREVQEPEAEPYTKLTAHQGRKLGADRPLWRRAISGLALLTIVVLIGTGIALSIGLIAGLASLFVERAV